MVSKRRYEKDQILHGAHGSGIPSVTKGQAVKAALYAHNQGEDLGEFIQMMGLEDYLLVDKNDANEADIQTAKDRKDRDG